MTQRMSNNRELADLWREWLQRVGSEEVDPVVCCGDLCCCGMCGTGAYYPDEIKHLPTCVYIRAKAIIEQED